MLTDKLWTFDISEFGNNYNDIFTDQLECKKKSDDPYEASFLDLSIEIYDEKFATELFNKADAFNNL